MMPGRVTLSMRAISGSMHMLASGIARLGYRLCPAGKTLSQVGRHDAACHAAALGLECRGCFLRLGWCASNARHAGYRCFGRASLQLVGMGLLLFIMVANGS